MLLGGCDRLQTLRKALLYERKSHEQFLRDELGEG
jgi:hypothetical protein